MGSKQDLLNLMERKAFENRLMLVQFAKHRYIVVRAIGAGAASSPGGQEGEVYPAWSGEKVHGPCTYEKAVAYVVEHSLTYLLPAEEEVFSAEEQVNIAWDDTEDEYHRLMQEQESNYLKGLGKLSK